jgi:hypothetical protein
MGHPTEKKTKRKKPTKRNYRKEYDNYHGKPEQIKRRDKRNAANAIAKKKGIVKKGDGKDVAHKNGNPNDNRTSNLVAQSKSKNRSYSRTKNAKKRNPKA